MCKRRLGNEIVGRSVGKLRERVGRQRRNDEQVGTCEMDVEVLPRRPPSQGRKGLSADEPLGPRRDQRDNLVPALDEEPNQLAGLVGGNSHGNPHKNASHKPILP